MTGLSNLETTNDTPAPQIRELFAEHGVIIARHLIELGEIQRFCQSILVLIRAALGHYGASANDENLDMAYRKLCAVDRDAGLSLRGMGKDLVEYHRLLANRDLGRILSIVIGSDQFQINYDQCLFRIDRPDEDKFAFDWHQDYPYNLLSQSAVTVWAPLTPITIDMGPMRVVPGSHTRLHSVVLDRSFEKKSFAKHNTIQLADHARLSAEFEAAGVDIVDINPGDVVLMHSLLVHRSGNNRSDRCRWVFNPRFGDLLDAQMVKRHWRSARAKSPFMIEEIHPEAVVHEKS
jgi:ectoine hydroxylase-related dioxygenase (phytanoyl-CoA dioxygenase family)